MSKHFPPQTVGIVTGSRADWGSLRPLINAIDHSATLNGKLYVTGAHLSLEYGGSKNAILESGHLISAEVDMKIHGDLPADLCRAISCGINGFSNVFLKSRPDLLLVLGDRFEILAPVQAAFLHRIPIAHLHGGENTVGSLDDSIRHAITKMAHLHFVANSSYRNRVLQLGEDPNFVFDVGSPGLDLVSEIELLSVTELSKALDFSLETNFFVVAYHPTTSQKSGDDEIIRLLLSTLEQFPNYKVVFTEPNPDLGSQAIRDSFRNYCTANPQQARCYPHLGSRRYLSALKLCTALIGNSSSGLTEAPLLGTPSVNIGMREQGRIIPPSVVQCSGTGNSIFDSIESVIARGCRDLGREFPTRKFGASRLIVEILEGINFGTLSTKQFVTLPNSSILNSDGRVIGSSHATQARQLFHTDPPS